MKFIGQIIKSFFDDDCMNLAANISFCALLAIIPMGMMMVSIAGYFLGGSQEVANKLVGMATNILPVGRDLFVANLQSIVDQKSSLGIIGVGFLVFIATILTGSIEHSLDVIFKTVKRRNFFHSRLLGILLILGITILFSLPTMVQLLEGLFARFGFNFPLSDIVSGRFFIFFVAFVAYLIIVVFVPNKKVYFRYAIAGGFLFAFGIGVAKFIFKWYLVVAMHRYNIIYGSLAAVVLWVVWIYYLAIVMLISAELVAKMQERMWFHTNSRDREIVGS